jgi:hypothetical protein
MSFEVRLRLCDPGAIAFVGKVRTSAQGFGSLGLHGSATHPSSAHDHHVQQRLRRAPFRRPTLPGTVGRLSQTWVRTPAGWKVVATHVCVIDWPG